MQRALYEEVTGKTSPSGQKPRSDEFYFAPLMRMHAGAFMMFYRQLSRRGVGLRSALVEAYEQYAKMCKGRPLMPIDRAWHLIMLADQRDGTVREAHCSVCGCYSLIQAHEGAMRYTCPACRGSLTVSERLRGRSGRKKKSEDLATLEATGSA